MESKYVTFTWVSDPVLQNRELSLRFCPDREFGYLTIELLVDGDLWGWVVLYLGPPILAPFGGGGPKSVPMSRKLAKFSWQGEQW